MLENIIKYFAGWWGLFDNVFLVSDSNSVWLQLAGPNSKAFVKSIDFQYKFLLSAKAFEFNWKITDTPGGCFTFCIGLPFLFNFKFTITSHYWHCAYKFTREFNDVSYGFYIGANGIELNWGWSQGEFLHRFKGRRFKALPSEIEAFLFGEIIRSQYKEEVLPSVTRYIFTEGDSFVIRITSTQSFWECQSSRMLTPRFREVIVNSVVEVIQPADISLPLALCRHSFKMKDVNCYESVVDSIVNDINGYLAK